eukprot:359522-Chlamydomonas_euryale.AAC.8
MHSTYKCTLYTNAESCVYKRPSYTNAQPPCCRTWTRSVPFEDLCAEQCSVCVHELGRTARACCPLLTRFLCRSPNAGAEETSVAASAPKHVSTKQVQLVQNLIERCMQSYISRVRLLEVDRATHTVVHLPGRSFRTRISVACGHTSLGRVFARGIWGKEVWLKLVAMQADCPH